ncbi:Ig-like domain (group 2) [Xylanibacter ruminicola]|uniref:Ig-like domain-containing protein n=1 Tax=Xylanibacter ruminicola TaxID=839 RepID=UPI0008F097F8|nr:Ig-like domain-containing protein [Xylanibacter ruminicola]SFB89877.1 Ig-like domain (group 2) [Xylanibacter ruminicola]
MKRVFRQILGWGMMLTLPLMMTSCEWFFDMLDNPITPALQVLRAQLTLKVGESKPIQASTQAHVVLLYSSDNPAVATVDATGLITAVSPGTARITIKAQGEDDYYRTEIFSENTTTVEVTVTKKDGSISFATASVKKYNGEANFINPLTIIGDGSVTYESNNTAVAEIDATTGEVTIKGVGTANIKATTTETETYAYETNTAQYTLTVDPAINLATLTGDYTAQNGDVLVGTLAGIYKISIADGASVELKDVTINSTGVNDYHYDWAGLTCDGNATITITGTNTIKGFYDNSPGIKAGPTSSTLTINGTGTLTATGGDFAAGIGSGWKATCGAITISGGTVNASSGSQGAGIGSGFEGSSCGAITISGGTVNASSSNAGAGIGSGYYNSSCGAITISGGTVNASSSIYGAGIGSGYYNSSCGAITISGGTVNASSGVDGAGIGSGCSGSSCGAITICGGTVNAISGVAGAGIGSGYYSTFGSITITAGITQVQATRNYTAVWPIGKGDCDQGSTGAVTINGVTVTSKDWDGTGLTDLNFATSSTGSKNLTWTLTPKVP